LNEVLTAFPSIALALLACLILAKLSLGIGVPRVSIYLLVGVALGPHGLMPFFGDAPWVERVFLGEASHHLFELVTPVAVGFILFRVGGEFQFRSLRQFGPRILALSGFEILSTGILVGVAVWAATGDFALGLIAPALAISTAPSATLLTLREVEAEGPTSRSLILLVGLNNLAALLAFPILMGIAFGTGHPFAKTAISFVGLFGGMAIGLVAALLLESFQSRKEHAVLGVLVVLGCLGFSNAISNDPMMTSMLACFGAGFVVVNGSARGPGLFESNQGMVYPLYVLFFLGSGRDLHLETLVALGALGFLFIAARVTGKFFGRLDRRATRRLAR
jgi:Kef-type K+ transport system membrane component KefB